MDELERDDVIERVRETLRGTPRARVDQRSVSRVLVAAWETPRPSAWRRAVDAWRLPAFSAFGAGALALGAMLIGFVTRGVVTQREPAAPVAASGAPTGEYPAQLAAFDAEAVRVPTQFVFENAEAQRVSLVGDFNDWKVGEQELVKLPNGLWTTTVALPPGRHVYSFMVDGTLLVADPRAPIAGDADYGHEGSVVMVFAR